MCRCLSSLRFSVWSIPNSRQAGGRPPTLDLSLFPIVSILWKIFLVPHVFISHWRRTSPPITTELLFIKQMKIYMLCIRNVFLTPKICFFGQWHARVTRMWPDESHRNIIHLENEDFQLCYQNVFLTLRTHKQTWKGSSKRVDTLSKSLLNEKENKSEN